MTYALWFRPILSSDIVNIMLDCYLSRGGMFRSYIKIIVTVVLRSWIFTFCTTLTFSIATINNLSPSISADSWSWTRFPDIKRSPMFSNTKVSNSSDFSVNVFENLWWIYIYHLHLISIVHSKKGSLLDFFMPYKILSTNCLFSLSKNNYFWVIIDRARFLYSFWRACSSVQHSLFVYVTTNLHFKNCG